MICAKVLLMKRGFTLIEILVSITIVALISGGALIYMNNFNMRQKLNSSQEEVVSALKLAQSYAKTRQLPLNSVESELNFVRIEVSSGGFLVARANSDVGTTFFSKLVNNNEIEVSTSPAVIYFWAGGGGRLSHDIDGTPYGVGETATVLVQRKILSSDYYQIVINALGQISGVNYVAN